MYIQHISYFIVCMMRGSKGGTVGNCVWTTPPWIIQTLVKLPKIGFGPPPLANKITPPPHTHTQTLETFHVSAHLYALLYNFTRFSKFTHIFIKNCICDIYKLNIKLINNSKSKRHINIEI